MNEESVDLGESTAKLSSAVENLPQILEKKRKIDSHVNIATSLLEQIKSRNLDEFYRIKGLGCNKLLVFINFEFEIDFDVNPA